MKEKLKLILGIVAPALLIDRLSKIFAQELLRAQPGEAFPVWPGVLSFHYAQNTGAAFSFLSGSTAFLAALSVLLLIFVLLLLLLGKGLSPTLRVALCLVLAGGLGNLYDRIFLGYVIDFVELLFVRFAIFNLADLFVCVGAGLAAIAVIARGEKARDA